MQDILMAILSFTSRQSAVVSFLGKSLCESVYYRGQRSQLVTSSLLCTWPVIWLSVIINFSTHCIPSSCTRNVLHSLDTLYYALLEEYMP